MNISLIIPAYNEENYIGTCLKSVRENASGLCEIIVVNNASTDNTEAIVKTFPEVKIVNESAKGLTKARQRGFTEAKGDIIAYIDADTKMPKGWVEKVLEEYEKDPHVVCVSGPYVYYDLPFWRKILIWLCWRVLASIGYFFIGYMAVGGNFAAKKTALEQIGGFDQNVAFYGEDTNIARRLSKEGKVKFIQRLYIYTSARRFRGEGLLLTAWRYVLNFLSEVLIKKPFSSKYKDIR